MTDKEPSKATSVFRSLAEKYPEHVVTYADGSKSFDMRALFRSKGWIE